VVFTLPVYVPQTGRICRVVRVVVRAWMWVVRAWVWVVRAWVGPPPRPPQRTKAVWLGCS
jgi:hypothetical protein